MVEGRIGNRLDSLALKIFMTLETPFEADMSRERWCSGLARNQVRNWGLNVSQAGIYLGIHSLYAVRPCAH